MTVTTTNDRAAHARRDERTEMRARLARALEAGARHLPAQAPLEVFVHHNTLHAYEHLPFHAAIEEARRHRGGEGYLSAGAYAAAFERGRIQLEDLDAAIADAALDLGPCPLERSPTASALVRFALLHDITPRSTVELGRSLREHEADCRFADGVSEIARARLVSDTLRWLRDELERLGGVDELPALGALLANPPPGVARTFAVLDECLRSSLEIPLERRAISNAIENHPERVAVAALWTGCQRACDAIVAPATTPENESRYLRDLLVSRGHDDPTVLVHAELIPACVAFLDRGQSHWSMPDRELGFFDAWSRMTTTGGAVRPAWLADLGTRLKRWRAEGVDAYGAIARVLSELGVEGDDVPDVIEHKLLSLPGWAGMFHKLETAPGPIGRSAAKVTLADFLAVRLVLDAQAARDVARRSGFRGNLSELAPHLARQPVLGGPATSSASAVAWPLFLLAQHAGFSARGVREAGPTLGDWASRFFGALDRATRLRIWHEAYERRYREELLDAVASNAPARAPTVEPAVQMVFCIDDRSESIRRHLEELSERHETFGAAGFFNLAIAYQGLDDPSTFPLCPVVLEPRHRISERPVPDDVRLAARRTLWRRRLGALGAAIERASRSVIWSPIFVALAGVLTAGPLLVQVFAPRSAARLRRAATRWLLPELRTELTVPRQGDVADATNSVVSGFTVHEKTERVGTLLRNMGLTHRFAPLVAIVGHDSSSVNNPHFAAYSCGACGGRSGGPNARLFARMANRPEVRARLRERGIVIPSETVFVGGVHDTCADGIRFYDVDRLPLEAAPRLEALGRSLDEALRRNAHERCRRFESAPHRASAAAAHGHVEERAVDISEPRPELGHATNAACVVGRRALTQGLFLDRRAFLVSYDPTLDADGASLERLLAAVGPVCAGINLEYYFSTTDNERYGAGTKLPHNVTALVGVMNGASSDLRTGLPKQMIEIHEPIRLELVVEATEEIVTAVLARQPEVRRLVENEWLRLVLSHPVSGVQCLYRRGRGFEAMPARAASLPVVSASAEWYGGRTGMVPPARLARSADRPGMPTEEA